MKSFNELSPLFVPAVHNLALNNLHVTAEGLKQLGVKQSRR